MRKVMLAGIAMVSLGGCTIPWNISIEARLAHIYTIEQCDHWRISALENHTVATGECPYAFKNGGSPTPPPIGSTPH